MSEENVDALPLTSVELLDAAVWREIDSEEPQPAAAFLEALSRLVCSAPHFFVGLASKYFVGKDVFGHAVSWVADR
jgi:hypothetical protein